MAKAAVRKRMKAYVLIETAAGKAKGVKKELANLKGGTSAVAAVDGVTGPYDFIAVVEGWCDDAVDSAGVEAGAVEGCADWPAGERFEDYSWVGGGDAAGEAHSCVCGEDEVLWVCRGSDDDGGGGGGAEVADA